MSEGQPTFQHDCTACTFLGTYAYEKRDYDLYHCLQGGDLPTVIARYGDDGDYTSSKFIAADLQKRGMHDHPLVIALDRAKERGLRVE